MREIVIFGLAGFLFIFFQLTGHDLAAQGNIDWTAGYVLRTMFISLAGAAACGWLGRYAAVTARRQKRKAAASGKDATDARKQAPETGRAAQTVCKQTSPLREEQVWCISAALIFLCWLPCYLAYYPGICAYDVTIQTGQIESGAYNDHHPIAHTLLLAGSMRIGQAFFGDINKGIGLLALLQVMLLALVFGWGVSLLYRRGVGKKWLLCLQAFGMFYPFHLYMSVSLIKDVFFTLFFLLQMLALCEMIRRRNRKADGYDLLFGASAIGMQLFRNNGRYAMLVLLAALVIAVIGAKTDRSFWLKTLAN